MRRSWTSIGVLALLVGACAGTAPSATPVVVAPTPTAPASTTTPTVAPTPVAIAASVSFDGKACVYTGPKVVPLNAEVTFTMTNLPAALQASQGAALIVLPVVKGTTWDQIVSDVAAAKSVSDEPDWVFLPDIGDRAVQVLYPDPAIRTLKVIPTMELDYLVMCATAPTETDKGFPAILLNVMPG